MLKKLVIACTLGILSLMNVAGAQENNDVVMRENPLNWEASMMPKPTAEEIEAARWSVVLENEVGVYAYDLSSLSFAQSEKGLVDNDTVNVLVKTVFTDKKMLKNLQTLYANKLKGKEKVQYCTMEMQYKMHEGLYTVNLMRVFTNGQREIDVQKKSGKFVSVPEGTFAEALYEICQNYSKQANESVVLKQNN